MGKTNRGRKGRGGRKADSSKLKVKTEKAPPKGRSSAVKGKLNQPKSKRLAGRLGATPKILQKSKKEISATLAARLGATTNTPTVKKESKSAKGLFDARSIIGQRNVATEKPKGQTSDLRSILKKKKDGVKTVKTPVKSDQKPNVVITVNSQKRRRKPVKSQTKKAQTKKAQTKKAQTKKASKPSSGTKNTKPRKNIVVECSFSQEKSPQKNAQRIEYRDEKGARHFLQQDEQQTFVWQLPTKDAPVSDPFKPVMQASNAVPKQLVADRLSHSSYKPSFHGDTYEDGLIHPRPDLGGSRPLMRDRSVSGRRSIASRLDATGALLPTPRQPLPPPREAPRLQSNSAELGLYNPNLWLNGQSSSFETHQKPISTTLPAPLMSLGGSATPDNHGDFLQTPLTPKAGRRSVYKIGVSHLHEEVDINDLYELFGDVGEVLSVEMLASGVAEVSYATYEEVAAAVEAYHLRLLDNRPMSVEYLGQVSN